MNENNCDLNLLNFDQQTVLHKICQGADDSIQMECMQIILENDFDASNIDLKDNVSESYYFWYSNQFR
jgi:hypothetical protein